MSRRLACLRESQEVVELALNGLLRACGIEPPRVHDVSDLLRLQRTRLPETVQADVDTLADASRRLRRDRELAFYGAEDRVLPVSLRSGVGGCDYAAEVRAASVSR